MTEREYFDVRGKFISGAVYKPVLSPCRDNPLYYVRVGVENLDWDDYRILTAMGVNVKPHSFADGDAGETRSYAVNATAPLEPLVSVGDGFDLSALKRAYDYATVRNKPLEFFMKDIPVNMRLRLSALARPHSAASVAQRQALSSGKLSLYELVIEDPVALINLCRK
jgi:hypothetical protein